jgi:hypothetical protein
MRNLTDSKDKRQTIHIEEHLIPESRNIYIERGMAMQVSTLMP